MSKIFGVGFSKTGTTSLEKSLGILGYKVCLGHWWLPHTFYLHALWVNGDIEEILRLTNYWDGFSDAPWGGTELYKELYSRYPDAKYIQTVRDPDRWYISLEKLLTMFDLNLETALESYHVNGMFGPERFFKQIFNIQTLAGNKQKIIDHYIKHNEEVICFFTEKRADFLVLEFPRGDGWPELCGFLGKPIPECPFPHGNQAIHNPYLSNKPKPAEAVQRYIDLGEELVEKGELDQAEKIFLEGIKIDSQNAILYNDLGMVAWMYGKLQKAKNHFEQSLLCDSKNISARDNLAALQSDEGLFESPATSQTKVGDIPTISVLIISYNFEKYLAECIESILVQSLLPTEILIVDDCSTDRSWEIISAYAQKHPELIKAWRQDNNMGPFHNWYTAFHHSTGELISSIDGDDLWLPDKLRTEIEALLANPEAKIAYSNVKVCNDEAKPTGVWFTPGDGRFPPSGDVFLQVISRKIFPKIRSLFRNELSYRTVLEEIGHDENIKIYLDFDHKIRATARFPVVYAGERCNHEPQVIYRMHQGGIHTKPKEELLADECRVYQKSLSLLTERPEKEAQTIKKQLEYIVLSADLKARYHLTYHVDYALRCQKTVGIAGKDVLEVGGSLPKAFVLQELKANSWTAIESPDYSLFSQKELESFPGRRDPGSTITQFSPAAKIGFQNTALKTGEYHLFHSNIEDLPPEHYGKYDLVFSIACFEHILKFPEALHKMYLALKPGGRFFSMFSPLWSGHNGHHLPMMKDNRGQVFTFNENCPIPPWGHLLMQADELLLHLQKNTDSQTAKKIIDLVYEAPFINRFFVEDYVTFIQQSDFIQEVLQTTFPVQISPEIQNCLETLYPGHRHFANNGLLVILKKSLGSQSSNRIFKAPASNKKVRRSPRGKKRR